MYMIQWRNCQELIENCSQSIPNISPIVPLRNKVIKSIRDLPIIDREGSSLGKGAASIFVRP
jgi:hypothetical protein